MTLIRHQAAKAPDHCTYALSNIPVFLQILTGFCLLVPTAVYPAAQHHSALYVSQLAGQPPLLVSVIYSDGWFHSLSQESACCMAKYVHTSMTFIYTATAVHSHGTPGAFTSKKMTAKLVNTSKFAATILQLLALHQLSNLPHHALGNIATYLPGKYSQPWLLWLTPRLKSTFCPKTM